METLHKARIEIDGVGMCLSALCAVHCAAFPALVAFGSFTAFVAARFHEYAAYAVAPIAFISARRAWELYRRADIAAALVAGSALLILACTPLRLLAYNLGVSLPETLALAAGVSLVSAGHWEARRVARRGVRRTQKKKNDTLFLLRRSEERIVWKGIWQSILVAVAAFGLTLAGSAFASPSGAALLEQAVAEQMQAERTEAAANPRANASYKRISFRLLRLYMPGAPPPKDVRELDGQKVEIMGFMAALIQLEDIDEFVLGSSPPMNCFCHPPGGINELILVEMRAGKSLPHYLSGVVSVRGTLKVNPRITLENQHSEIMYSVIADDVL